MLPAPTPASLAAWLDSQDSPRMNHYREMLDFYNGRQWQGRPRAGETRLVFNYARVLVRKAASYLMPAPVIFNVLPADGESAMANDTVRLAERALNAVYAGHDQHTIDFQSALDAAVLGDGAFKITWSARRNMPLIAPVDPATLWAFWEPDNPNEVYRVLQRYQLSADETVRLFGIAPLVDRGPSSRVTVVEDWRAERYRIEVDGQVLVDDVNPYGWIPYVIYPNIARPHEFWGASDLDDLLDVCRELNGRMTTISRILHVAGYPITVLENVTGSDGIRAEAGAIWELPEDSKAYLLDMLGGAVGLHIEYVNLLYRQLHDLSETPRTAFGDSGRSLSGVALEVEIQPLVQKVLRKRRVWDSVHRRRNAMVLDLLERFGSLPLAGLRDTRTIWGEVLPRDRAETARTEASLVAANIHSRKHAMGLLGEQDPDMAWQAIIAELGALQSLTTPDSRDGLPEATDAMLRRS